MQVDAPKAKYTHTKELVRHAREKGGLTEVKIAKMCGVQQSVVSNWSTGPKKATIEQIKPLVEMFGDVVKKGGTPAYLVCENIGFELNEAVFKEFSDFVSELIREREETVRKRQYFGKVLPDYRKPKIISNPELREKFESEIGRYESRLAQFESVQTKYEETIQENAIKDLKNTLQKLVSMEGQVFKNQDEFLELFSHLPKRHWGYSSLDFRIFKNDLLAVSHKYNSQIVQVNGDIIFEYTFEREKQNTKHRWAQNDDEKIPWMKWVVHDLGGGKFCWLVQQPLNTLFPIDTQRQPNDIWLSKIEDPDDVEGILASARNYPLAERQKSAVNLEALTFLITKAFLDRGYAVEGVRVIQTEKSN